MCVFAYFFENLKQRFQNAKREIISFDCRRQFNKGNIINIEHEFRRHSLA